MNTYLLFDPAGRVIQSVKCPTEDAASLAVMLNLEYIEDVPGTGERFVDLSGAAPAVVVRPQQPESPSVDDAREVQAQAVDRIRSARHGQPIAYMGEFFDADVAARENISGVLTRLTRGDGLTAGWIGWRTFDNNMVWADEPAEEVLSHLRGLSCAIEDRKQALLSVAWGHKDALAELSSVEAVMEYDITAGWPA